MPSQPTKTAVADSTALIVTVAPGAYQPAPETAPPEAPAVEPMTLILPSESDQVK